MAFWSDLFYPTCIADNKSVLGCDAGDGVTDLCSSKADDAHAVQARMAEAQRRAASTSSDRCGVGLEFGQLSSGTLVVRKNVPGSPAALCGHIEAGDVLLKIDRKKVNYAPVAAVAQAMLGQEGTEVLLTFLRSFRLCDNDVEHIIYSVRLHRQPYGLRSPVPAHGESPDKAAGSRQTLPPRGTPRVSYAMAAGRQRQMHSCFSMTSIYIPFSFNGVAYARLAPTEQVTLMEKMMAYKVALKDLAAKCPAHGEPNAVITENFTRAEGGRAGSSSLVSAAEPNQTLAATVMIACQSVMDVRDTNTVVMKDMILKASQLGLEFTVESSGEGWREGL